MELNKEVRADMFQDVKNAASREDVGRIFVYGAGQTGLLVYFLLRQCNIQPYAFVVSRRVVGKIYAISMPIVEYKHSLFEKDDIVLIAACGRAQEEIQKHCEDECCKKIVITEKFCKRYLDVFRNEIDEILWTEGAFLYKNNHEEKKTIGKYFKEADVATSDFSKKFLQLTRNLEPSSKDIIVRSIQRTRKVNSCNDVEMDIFSDDEKKEILKANNFFKNQIVELRENIWYCRGYFLPLNDFSPVIFYDRLGMAALENLEKCKDKDILDVGGFIGDSALVLSEVTQGKVHIFEPIESNLKLLEETRKLNQINVSVVNMAVSNQEGVISFSVDESNSTSSTKEIDNRIYEKKIKVKTTTIDRYVEENKLHIGLVKIHAEGMEQEVIKGAVKLIKEQAPAIIVEIGHTESDFFDIKPLLESINSEYKFRVFKPSNGLVCLGLKLIAEVR